MLPTLFGDPFREMRDMERRMMSVFDRYPLFSKEQVAGDFSPSVNLREGEYAYHIEADIPGVAKDDIKVDVENGRVTLSGQRQTKEEVKKEDYYRMESIFGSFSRSFALPEDVDLENMHAEHKDGVLEVVIPKKAKEGKEAARTIPVK